MRRGFARALAMQASTISTTTSRSLSGRSESEGLTRQGHPSSFRLHPSFRSEQRSERNVVVHLVERPAALLALLGLAAATRAGRGRLARHGLRPAAATAAAAAAQHLHAVRDDLGGVLVLAFLVLPLAGADAALDVDRRAFLEVLAGDLRELAEEGDAVPLGVLLRFSRLVLPLLGGRDADIGHRVAGRQIAGLRVPAEVADQYHFVYRSHFLLLIKAASRQMPAASVKTVRNAAFCSVSPRAVHPSRVLSCRRRP